jgi:hypothetical protein
MVSRLALLAQATPLSRPPLTIRQPLRARVRSDEAAGPFPGRAAASPDRNPVAADDECLAFPDWVCRCRGLVLAVPAPALAAFVAWLAVHPGADLVVMGFALSTATAALGLVALLGRASGALGS